MAGSVRVESTVGLGTKFIITFKTSCQVSNNNDKFSLISKKKDSAENFEQNIKMVQQLFLKNSQDGPAHEELKLPYEEKPWILVANDDHFMLQVI